MTYEDFASEKLTMIKQLQDKAISLEDVLISEMEYVRDSKKSNDIFEDVSTLHALIFYRTEDIKYRQIVNMNNYTILEKLLEKNILSGKPDPNDDLSALLNVHNSWHMGQFLKGLSQESKDSCTQVCHDSRCKNIIQEWGKLCEQLQNENLKFVRTGKMVI